MLVPTSPHRQDPFPQHHKLSLSIQSLSLSLSLDSPTSSVAPSADLKRRQQGREARTNKRREGCREGSPSSAAVPAAAQISNVRLVVCFITPEKKQTKRFPPPIHPGFCGAAVVRKGAMGQQQQQQSAKHHLRPVVEPAKMMGNAGAPAAAPARRNTYSLDDVSSTCLAKQASARLLLNPWRELTPSDFVIGYARGMGRVRCSTCLTKITQGELQVRERERVLATPVLVLACGVCIFFLVSAAGLVCAAFMQQTA